MTRIVLIVIVDCAIALSVLFAIVALNDTSKSEFVDLYQRSMRAALFSGFLSLGGFLFAMKTFIVVKMKELVYDRDGYVEYVRDVRQLDRRASHYGPLLSLSRLLLASIASCFAVAILQFTLGLSTYSAAIGTCVGAAAFAIWMLGAALYFTSRNLRRMFEFIEQEAEAKLAARQHSDTPAARNV